MPRTTLKQYRFNTLLHLLGPQAIQDIAYPRVLHAQGQIHPVQLLREARRYPRRVSQDRGCPPILRRPHERALRPRSLQARAWTGTDSENSRRSSILAISRKHLEISQCFCGIFYLSIRELFTIQRIQLNTARHLVENVSKDYVRLLKYGDSLYRCKQLKKAALGRMATIIKRQSQSLSYLEEVKPKKT